MTSPSEHWIVSELRHATDRMPLPPESRWVRERRSVLSPSTIAAVSALAILTIALLGGIGALRTEQRVVPAAGADAFAIREDGEWRLTQSMVPSTLPVLRPTWIPGEFRGSPTCPSPWATLDSLGPGYLVRYQSRPLPDGRCTWLLVTGVAKIVSYAGIPDGLSDTGTVDARGTVIHVRSGTPIMGIGSPAALEQIRLWWNESGATYEVVSNDLEIAELVRVVRSLEPMP